MLPGVTVTITNTSTGVVQNAVSEANGTYDVRYLIPGDYTVQVGLQGFRSERTAFTLRVAK